jgi:gliding motility-associated-like protein
MKQSFFWVRVTLRVGPVGLILSFLHLLLAPSARAEVTLSIRLDPDQVTYRVFMSSTVRYTGLQSAISTSQVTLSVPHGMGDDRFVPTDLVSPIPGMVWTYGGRAAAPTENPDRDYLFFNFINNQWPTVAFDIEPGKEYLLFSFKRKGNCLGMVQLFDNQSDEFRVPNSLGINVGNQLSILGALGNVYKTNNEAPPTLTIQASQTLVCTGETVQLTALPSVPPASATATYTYQWFADDQPLGPASPSPDLTYSPPAQSGAGGQVRIRAKLFIKGATTCEGQFVSASVWLAVQTSPPASLHYTGTPCTPLPVVITANLGSNLTYQWQRNGADLPGAMSVALSVTQTGTYAVKVSLDGCETHSNAQSIIGQAIGETVTVSLPTVLPVLEGVSAQFQPVVSNGVSYSWTPATGLSSATVAAPVARATETTTYTLTTYGATGCPASATTTLTVIPGLRIPNAFSPNGDLQNDTWQILNLEHHPNTVVWIYDRWGRLVHQAEATAAGWLGDSAEVGTYRYVVSSPYYDYAGTLTLLR